MIAQKTVRIGTSCLALDELHPGAWIGERTLCLFDGTVVVFISPFKTPGK